MVRHTSRLKCCFCCLLCKNRAAGLQRRLPVPGSVREACCIRHRSLPLTPAFFAWPQCIGTQTALLAVLAGGALHAVKPPPRTLELESPHATHCPAACDSWLQPAAGAAGHYQCGVPALGNGGSGNRQTLALHACQEAAHTLTAGCRTPPCSPRLRPPSPRRAWRARMLVPSRLPRRLVFTLSAVAAACFLTLLTCVWCINWGFIAPTDYGGGSDEVTYGSPLQQRMASFGPPGRGGPALWLWNLVNPTGARPECQVPSQTCATAGLCGWAPKVACVHWRCCWAGSVCILIGAGLVWHAKRMRYWRMGPGEGGYSCELRLEECGYRRCGALQTRCAR